jgi:hypothetical protein
MLSIRFLILSLFLLLQGSGAFTVAPPQTARSSSSTRTFLLPEQASDLEACAYDLMKAAADEENLKQLNQEMSSQAKPEFMGPVGWCRRLLQQSSGKAQH